MRIKFYANEKKYGTKAVNMKPINLEITSVSQVLETIRGRVCTLHESN